MDSLTTSKIIEDITRYLKRSLKKNAPLLIFCEYQNENEKALFIADVRREMNRICALRTLDPYSIPEHKPVFLYMREHTTGNTVFLVNSYPQEKEGERFRVAPDFLSYLNVNRDQLHKHKIKVVFFIHAMDTPLFMINAPDLWVHRHRFFVLDEETRPAEFGELTAFEPSDRKLSPEDEALFQTRRKTAEQLLKETRDPLDRVTVLTGLARFLMDRHAYKTATRTWVKALDEFSTRPNLDPGEKEKTIFNLAYSYGKIQQFPEALKLYEESLKICRETGDRRGEGTTLNNISQIYDAQGKYDKALQYLRDSLAIRREIGDPWGEGATLNNIASIYDAQGKYDKALQYLQDSLEICRETGDRQGEGTTLNNISSIYHAWGKDDKALQYLNDSLEIQRETGDRQGEGVTLSNMAQLFEKTGEIEKAISLLEESVKIGKELKHPDLKKGLAYLETLRQRKT